MKGAHVAPFLLYVPITGFAALASPIDGTGAEHPAADACQRGPIQFTPSQMRTVRI